MKYLKRINESEEEFTQDLKEILLEVEDFGYYTNVVNNRSTSASFYYLEIDSYEEDDEDDSRIVFEEVKDCLLRLKDYIGDRYISCEIYKDEWFNYNLTENSKVSDTVDKRLMLYMATAICIDYKKQFISTKNNFEIKI